VPTPDDIGPDTCSTNEPSKADAAALLTEARTLLRDVLPATVRQNFTKAAAMLHMFVPVERLLQALRFHASRVLPLSGTADVRIQCHERYLSVAGVVALLSEGAIVVGGRPLHTGRYLGITVHDGNDQLAAFWFPEVPVFRVPSRALA
jgi:hypothetical protein